jgi:hypothetical protein
VYCHSSLFLVTTAQSRCETSRMLPPLSGRIPLPDLISLLGYYHPDVVAYTKKHRRIQKRKLSMGVVRTHRSVLASLRSGIKTILSKSMLNYCWIISLSSLSKGMLDYCWINSLTLLSKSMPNYCWINSLSSFSKSMLNY